MAYVAGYGLFFLLIVVLGTQWHRRDKARLETKQRHAEQRKLRAPVALETAIPPLIFIDIEQRYPHLKNNQTAHELVSLGLQHYFYAVAMNNWQAVGVPSKLVQMAWDTFREHEQAYAVYCQQVFAELLTTQATTSSRRYTSHDALGRTWEQACLVDGITPGLPERMPLLFALDERLGVNDGYRYTLPETLLVEDDERFATSLHGTRLWAGASVPIISFVSIVSYDAMFAAVPDAGNDW